MTFRSFSDKSNNISVKVTKSLLKFNFVNDKTSRNNIIVITVNTAIIKVVVNYYKNPSNFFVKRSIGNL